MTDYTLADLESWAERIQAVALDFGLDCYPQEFEMSDHHQMLGYMAYSGAPCHYPHWSYGKSFEKLKTLYDLGVSDLPYEMVINTNPCLAYLMRDNSLLLQILTVAHVYGHNDFFKNNFTFRTTQADHALPSFKARAQRIRGYVEDPSIGIDRVESMLDAAHALAFQCRRNLSAARSSPEAQKARIRQQWWEASGSDNSGAAEEPDEEALLEALRKTPLEPDEDLLLFIRDHNPHLEEWERDLLTIVDEENRYFIPQIETKIMNEGWASYWHKRILDSMDLPAELKMEFLVRHAQVLSPHPGGLNPYHVGYSIWNALRIWYDGMLDAKLLRSDEHDLFQQMREDFEERDAVPPDSGEKSGEELLFEVRETDRDTSFLRRFLTPALMQELDLFQHESKRGPAGQNLRVVTQTSDEGWREIKETLIRAVGMGSFPVIRVEDANQGGNSTLLLGHCHDGRDLEREEAEKTLRYVHRLWGNPVILQTRINGKGTRVTVDSAGEVSVETGSAKGAAA